MFMSISSQQFHGKDLKNHNVICSLKSLLLLLDIFHSDFCPIQCGMTTIALILKSAILLINNSMAWDTLSLNALFYE